MIPVRFNRAAQAELDHAAEVHDIARPGFGAKLRDAVRRTTELIVAHPGIGEKVRGSQARRVLVSGFSYSIVYVAHPTVIAVYAIAHHKRRPNYFRPRLPESS